MLSRLFHTSVVLSAAALATLAFAAPPADFTVQSGDKTFRLADARGKFVALHFLLKTECPMCLRYVMDTVRRSPELAGVEHVFLKPDPEDEFKRWTDKAAEAGVAIPIYRDPDAKLAKQFEIPDGYAFHGESVHYPALVLIGPDGTEVFRYVGKSNTDRMPFDQLVDQVGKLGKSDGIKHYNLADGALAIKGYDPVTYLSGKPAAGKREFISRYRGATYQFTSAENRAKFAADPEKYAPAYGGWCATAMAEGDKVDIDPANYQITNGRLFLFYKGWLGDAKKDWNKAEAKLTREADAHWTKIAPGDRISPK